MKRQRKNGNKCNIACIFVPFISGTYLTDVTLIEHYCLRRMNTSSRNSATMPNTRDISALLVRPATRNVKNDTEAVVNAYGNWVATWFRCLLFIVLPANIGIIFKSTKKITQKGVIISNFICTFAMSLMIFCMS